MEIQKTPFSKEKSEANLAPELEQIIHSEPDNTLNVVKNICLLIKITLPSDAKNWINYLNKKEGKLLSMNNF